MHVTRMEETPAVWRLRLSAGQSDGIYIDRQGTAQLDQALAEAEASDECRVVIIEGEPGIFCLGLDLRQLVATGAADVAVRAADFAGCLLRICRSSKYTLAIVDGVVQGGGVGIVGAADLVIATAGSSFGLPEIVLGLVPAMVMPILMQRMPLQKVRRLALQEAFDARAAEAAGLVDQLVPERRRLAGAVRGAVKHALRLNPSALEKMKTLARQIEGMKCEVALQVGKDVTAELLADPRILAHLRDFIEGAAPPWFQQYRPVDSRNGQEKDGPLSGKSKRQGPLAKREEL